MSGKPITQQQVKLYMSNRNQPDQSQAKSAAKAGLSESFFGSLKQERVQWRNYQTRNEAQQDVMNSITMWYNSHRLHSYLGYKSPNQFEFEMQIPRLELKKAS